MPVCSEVDDEWSNKADVQLLRRTTGVGMVVAVPMSCHSKLRVDLMECAKGAFGCDSTQPCAAATGATLEVCC
jgi:hypothetical protein